MRVRCTEGRTASAPAICLIIKCTCTYMYMLDCDCIVTACVCVSLPYRFELAHIPWKFLCAVDGLADSAVCKP